MNVIQCNNSIDFYIKSLIEQIDYVKGTLSGLRQFLAIERPLKMMKSAFYCTSKALFVLKIFNLCLDFWSCSKTTSLER